MIYLKNLSREVARYKRQHGQYWLDEMVEQFQKKERQRIAIGGSVLAILRQDEFGLELIVPGLNIVTDKGDKYYAQSAAAESPTDDFDGAASGMRHGSAATGPTKSDNDVTTFLSGSPHALDATYEKTADGDADNTGAAVDTVTWRFSYTTAEGNNNGIQEGAICDNRTTPTGALTHFLFAASFNKTSSDTLKVFVNHNMLGV